MSKLWILLLVVAAIQYGRSYPTEYELTEIDDEENDEPIDFMSDEQTDEERGFNLKGFGKSIGKGLGKAGKAIGKAGKSLGKKLKKLKGPMKAVMKKGKKLLKMAGVKVNPLDCEEKTCRSCITMKIPMEMSCCVKMRFMKTNKATYFVVSLTKDDVPKLEKKLKMGDVSNCVDIGGIIGRVCLKALEGRAKSSKGEPQANFCLAILAEKFGFGCKFCATYENKKLKVKFSPTTFPGGTSDDGEIVELAENGEDGVELGADEIETD